MAGEGIRMGGPGVHMPRALPLWTAAIVLSVCCPRPQAAVSTDAADAAAVVTSTPRPQNGSLPPLEVTRMLDELLADYDGRFRPGFGGPPTVVDVNMNIRSMGPISEKNMVYQLNCYFRQNWVDERLKFDGPIQTLPISIRLLNRLWKPDTQFFNGRKCLLHTMTTPNKFLRINKDGRVQYSMRLTVRAGCPMHLESFPMDTQMCQLTFGSNAYTADEVTYTWTNGARNSVEIASDMALSQYDLVEFPAGNLTVTGRRGQFSTLYVNFTLRRHMGYFLINIYVPCSLLVVLSWVGFWINREATSDRIALGITIVLSMAFIGVDNRSDTPRVSYPTAMDYYVSCCLVFISVSIVQFAGVHFFTKRASGERMADGDGDGDGDDDYYDEWEGRDDADGCLRNSKAHDAWAVQRARRWLRDHKPAGPPPMTGLRFDAGLIQPRSREGCCTMLRYCLAGSAHYQAMRRRYRGAGETNSVSRIDRLSRVIFPLAFVLFNVAYWVAYGVVGTSNILM